MPPSSVKVLNKAIAGGELEPVYLLHGEDEYLKDAKVRRMIEAVLEPAERDFNLDVVRGAEVAAASLDSLLSTPPMFAEHRVIVIRDVTSLRKDAREVLRRYIDSPARDLVLILVAEGELPKAEKDLSPRSSVVEFTRLSGNQLEKWVQHHAESELGAQLTPGAVNLLLACVGDDLPQIASELDKLASYTGNDIIDEAAVEDLVGVRRGETLPDLLDAVAHRDAVRALPLVSHVMAESRTTAVSVVLAFTAQFLGLAYARALLDEGRPRARLSGELFGLLRSGRAAVGRPWGEAVELWMRTADSWTLSELLDACGALLRADMAQKETRASSDEQLIVSLVLELCAAGGGSRPRSGR